MPRVSGLLFCKKPAILHSTQKSADFESRLCANGYCGVRPDSLANSICRELRRINAINRAFIRLGNARIFVRACDHRHPAISGYYAMNQPTAIDTTTNVERNFTRGLFAFSLIPVNACKPLRAFIRITTRQDRYM